MTPTGHLLCPVCEGAGSTMTLDSVEKCYKCAGHGSLSVAFHTSSAGFAIESGEALTESNRMPTIGHEHGDRPTETGRDGASTKRGSPPDPSLDAPGEN